MVPEQGYRPKMSVKIQNWLRATPPLVLVPLGFPRVALVRRLSPWDDDHGPEQIQKGCNKTK